MLRRVNREWDSEVKKPETFPGCLTRDWPSLFLESSCRSSFPSRDPDIADHVFLSADKKHPINYMEFQVAALVILRLAPHALSNSIQINRYT